MIKDDYKIVTVFEKSKPVDEVSIEILDNDTLFIKHGSFFYKEKAIVPIITIDYNGKSLGMIYGSVDTTYMANSVYKIDVHINIEYNKVSEISVFLK